MNHWESLVETEKVRIKVHYRALFRGYVPVVVEYGRIPVPAPFGNCVEAKDLAIFILY